VRRDGALPRGFLVALRVIDPSADAVASVGLLPDNADETDRALHALASERATIAALARNGASTSPASREALLRLAGIAPIVGLSEASRPVTAAWLEATGLRDAMRAVVTGDDGVPPPSPDRVLRALARLGGVRASDVLLVDASMHGIRAARAAGVPALWCGDAPASGPDLPTITSLAALGPTEVRAIFSGLQLQA
jgi:HAD superfamily hydrolase (TIGR01509 family)